MYVGQTKNFVARKANHLYAARKGNERPLYRAIRKYGEDAFEFSILEECDDHLINERETYWVSHYGSFNPEKGYNLTSGGNQYSIHSPETKKRISDSIKRRNAIAPAKYSWSKLSQKQRDEVVSKARKTLQSDAHRLKMSKLTTGENNPMWGRKGEKSPVSKLTVEKVELARKLIEEGKKDKEIALIIGVSRTTILRIRNKQIWKCDLESP